MLFRLVRPMNRKGTQNKHYMRRIPRDVRELATGLRLSLPVGDEFCAITIPAASTLSQSQSVNRTVLSNVSITGLLETWWAEAKARRLKQSTYESYRTAVTLLVASLRHDDAKRVTHDDILAFKDARIAAGISPKTVNDSNLSALKGLFGWAVRNRKLDFNPAKEVGVKPGKAVRIRSKGFTDDEADSILQHAASHTQGPTEAWQIAMAKRWVPWLCAFTGARVGEMVQLRKEDVRPHGDAWIIRITPEAGTVKDNQAREVPLHSQLIETGFIRFWEAAPPGHLFMVVAGDGEVAWRAGWRTAKNRVREFVREVFKQEGVQPNHAWRHRFKTLGRGLKIDSFTLHALQGHAAETVGDSYGDVPMQARISAINSFPPAGVEVVPFDASKLRWGSKRRRSRKATG